jgi:hypothetical protein
VGRKLKLKRSRLAEIKLSVQVHIDNLFDGDSGEASIGEQDSERWIVLVEFVTWKWSYVRSELEHQVV